MSNYRRLRIPGGLYFFTIVTAARRPILLDHITELQEAFRVVRREHSFELDAMVILPDHLHYNPVKHGYIARPIDWPYSSFRRFVERGVYSRNWGTYGTVDDLDVE